jgi:hypothetical protein
LCFSPGGDFLVTTSLDGTLRIWEPKQGSLIYAYQGPEIGATAVGVSEDNSRIAAGWADGSVHILDAGRREETSAVQVEDGIVKLSFGTSRDQLVTISNTGCVQVWNLANGLPTTLYEGSKKRGELMDVVMTLSEDRQLVAFSPTLCGTVHVWSLWPIEEVCKLAEEGVNALALSRTRNLLAASTINGRVSLWSLSQGVTRDFSEHSEVNQLAFSTDCKHLISGTGSQSFRTGNEAFDLALMGFGGPRLAGARMMIWDVESGQCCETIDGYGDTGAIAAASGGWRGIVRGSELVIQKAESGREIAWFPAAPRIIKAHPSLAIWAGAIGSQLLMLRLEQENVYPDLVDSSLEP